MFDKSKVGVSFPPFTIEVERYKIAELALAIGDDNPVYHSREAAQTQGFKDVPLSPTTATIFSFWGNTEQWHQLEQVGIDVKRILHSEEEYEYLAPVYPGDVLTGTTTIIDGKTRKLKDGSMDIVTTETRYTNHDKQSVLVAKSMLIVRE
jgi:acyl dehydratase